jgi:hypothetical protein
MVTRGLSERRALAAVRMSASALRYVRRPDQDAELRDRIVALAQTVSRSCARDPSIRSGPPTLSSIARPRVGC